MTTFRWSVTFETAALERGTADTREAAERAAQLAHTVAVCKGLNPDALAYHVREVTS